MLGAVNEIEKCKSIFFGFDFNLKKKFANAEKRKWGEEGSAVGIWGCDIK